MPIITTPDWVPQEEADYDEGKPIRSEQGLSLAGNPIAIANGAAGAPRVLRAAINDAAINRVKLSTTAGSQAWGFSSGGGTLTINLPAYCFFPVVSGTGNPQAQLSAFGANADSPALIVTATGLSAGAVYWRGVNA